MSLSRYNNSHNKELLSASYLLVVEHGDHVDGLALVQGVHPAMLQRVQGVHQGFGGAVAATLVVQAARAHELVARANHRGGLHVRQLQLEVQNVTGRAAQALMYTSIKSKQDNRQRTQEEVRGQNCV